MVLRAGGVAAQFTLAVQDSWHWSIGTSSVDAFKQYANLLSVTPVFRVMEADINDTINWLTVGSNVLVMLLAGSAAALLLNGRGYEL
ncbi:hypothetical protein D3C80_2020230 [compost metagenome]